MPKALEEKANKLRLELAAINDKLEALSREERALREAASGASGREREKLLIEEILRKGGE